MTAFAPTVPLLSGPSLTMLDRCDRCGAQAFVRAVLPTGTDLLFCGHHAKAARPGLLMAGAELHDETERLTIRRESGFG